jgi:DNA-binding CsgD family transcriptional regulator
VKFHLTNIYRKLRVENRTQAAAWAVEWLCERGATA